MRAAYPVLIAAAALGLGGCLGSAVGVLTAPVSMASGAVGNVGTQALNAGGGPVSDIDRILTAHPDAANSGELSALRSSLLEQGLADPGAPAAAVTHADEFDRHARRSKRLRSDRPALDPPLVTGAVQGPLQREESKPFATARTSSLAPQVRRWYDIPITPIRITQLNDGRRASRDAERGGR